MSPNILYLGVKAHVVAIDQNDGRTLWETKLKGRGVNGDSFVSLLVEGNRVYAHTYGELYCLDAASGQLLWLNPLDGLSYNIATLATANGSNSVLPTEAFRRKQQIAAAGAAATSSSASS